MSEEDLLKPGQSIRPNVSTDTAKKLVEDYFGYEVLRVKELNSYDDNNFLVEGKNSAGTPAKYILKVLNSIDSRKCGHIEAENGAMVFLSEHGINCPIPQESVEGNTYKLVDISSGTTVSRHAIRLLTFLEGKIMYEVAPTTKMLFNAGAYVAQIDNILKDYNHAALPSHSSNWQMKNTPELRKFVYVIKEHKERYDMVMSILDAFDQRVVPSYPNLEKGVIHGDYNEQNVIIRPDSESGHSIHGIIDFGDLQIACYVFELAIALCYMMLECTRVGEIDPFVGGGHFLKGYSKYRKITQNEMDVLRILISARLCQSVVMGAYTYSQNPGNEYLLITAKSGWELMHKLWNETSDEQLQTIWKEIL